MCQKPEFGARLKLVNKVLNPFFQMHEAIAVGVFFNVKENFHDPSVFTHQRAFRCTHSATLNLHG